MALRSSLDRSRHSPQTESTYLVLGDIAQNLERAAALSAAAAASLRDLDDTQAPRIAEVASYIKAIIEIVRVERERLLTGVR